MTPRSPGRDQTGTRPGTGTVTAVAGWVLVLADALLAVGAAVVLQILVSRPVAVLLPAAAALIILVGVVLAMPRQDGHWIGADGNGRTVEGSEPTTWSFGVAGALLGAVVVTVLAVRDARTSRPLPRGGPE